MVGAEGNQSVGRENILHPMWIDWGIFSKFAAEVEVRDMCAESWF